MNGKTMRERYAAAASALTIQFEEEMNRIMPTESQAKDCEKDEAEEESKEQED